MKRKRNPRGGHSRKRPNGIPIARLGVPRPFWTRPAWIRGTRMAAPAAMLAGLALLALPVPDWRIYGGLGGLLSVRNISMWLALLLPATALAVSAVPRRGRLALTAAGTAAWLVCLASTAMSLSVCVPGSGTCVDYPAGGYGQTRRLCLLALAAGLDAAAMLGLYRQTLIRKKEKEMKRQEEEKETSGPDRGVVAVMAGMMLMAVPLLTAGKITIPRICLCLMTLLPAMALGLAGLGTPVRRTMRVALTAGGVAGLLVVMATDYDLIPTAWAESSWWALDYGVGYSTGAQLVLVLLSLAAILANALLVAADTMRERYQAPSKAAGHQHVEAAPRRGRHTAGDER